MRYTYEEYVALNDKLCSFFELIIKYMCRRCAIAGNFDPDWEKGGKPHHSGIINNYLRSSRMIKDHLNIFFNDINHGYFHGLMTAFIAFIMLKDKDKADFERIFSSCLLHDFVKAIEGSESKRHDERLSEYFPEFIEETYGHKIRANEYQYSPIVLADRIELMRYSNYQEWTDERLTRALNHISPEDRRLIQLFYETVRPALRDLYTNRNSIWIKHGNDGEMHRKQCSITGPPSPHNLNWDIVMSMREDDNYPKTHWDKYKDSEAYAIEQDTFPFGTTSGRHERAAPGWLSLGHCSCHAPKTPWGLVKGYIDHENFTKKGGVIINSQMRDHLLAKAKIKMKDWIFIDTLEIRKSVKIKPWFVNYLSRVINMKSTRTISESSVFLFGILHKITLERLTLLNLK